MLTSTHLFLGAAIGKAVGNIYMAIPVALASHYLLDAIPHYNPGPVKSYLEKDLRGANKKDLFLKSIEPLIGVGIISYAVLMSNVGGALPLVLGAFFGWLPDFFVFLEWKFNKNRGFIRKIEQVNHRHTTFLKGIISQVIICVLALWYIF